MPQIKAILVDFDGTLLQKDQVYISLRNMYAIRQAMARGVHIIPATGRVVDMVPPQIEAEPGIRYWVTSSGGRVVDRHTGDVIHTATWTPEESAELCRIFEGQQIYAEIAAAGKIYLEQAIADQLERCAVPPHHVWFLAMGRQISVERPSEHFLKHRIGIEKLNLYGIPPEKQEILHRQLEDTGFVWHTDPVGEKLQCFPKNADKIFAIRTLLDRLNLTLDQVMSLGDGILDSEIICQSGIGVAMGNAPDWLKAQADYVTASFDEDGVAEAIERFVL